MRKVNVEPTVIQVVKRPYTYMNHSYRDFSKVPADKSDKALEDIESMCFPQKVHHILSQPHFSDIVHWMPHGRAFKVAYPIKFEREICPKYFGHKRYSSFLRQLSNHGFKLISQGPDRNCHYSEFLLRDLPHLCTHFGPPKEARHLIPDPKNEPDFYAISRQFPVPGGEDLAFDSSVRKEWNDAGPSKANRRPTVSLDKELPCAKRQKGESLDAHGLVKQLSGVGEIYMPFLAMSPPLQFTPTNNFIHPSDVLAQNLTASLAIRQMEEQRRLEAEMLLLIRIAETLPF